MTPIPIEVVDVFEAALSNLRDRPDLADDRDVQAVLLSGRAVVLASREVPAAPTTDVEDTLP